MAMMAQRAIGWGAAAVGVIAAALACEMSACSSSDDSSTQPIADAAPEASFTDPDGGTHSLTMTPTAGCFMSWSFPGGLAATNDPCTVTGGMSTSTGAVFLSIEDAYRTDSLGGTVTVQIDPQLPVGTLDFTPTLVEDNDPVNVLMGNTASVACYLMMGFAAEYGGTTQGSLSIDITRETATEAHGTINATIDCVDTQAHAYLGPMATMQVTY